jgi:hypothetical protein
MAKIIFLLLFFTLSSFAKEDEPRFGLIPREPPLSVEALQELAFLGIEYTFSTSYQPPLEIEWPLTAKGGILLIAPPDDQTEALLQWIEQAPVKPSQLILINQTKRDLRELKKQIEKLGISCCITNLQNH